MSIFASILRTAYKLSGAKKAFALPEDALRKEIEKQNRHRGVFTPTDCKAHYETITVNGFPCLIVREHPKPSERAILYFFGGGMVIGPDKGDLPVMRKLCREIGCDVWFPFYPLCMLPTKKKPWMRGSSNTPSPELAAGRSPPQGRWLPCRGASAKPAARRLGGNDRQVLVATHFNTGTYHNHFVVNPVNMWTGKKLEAKYEVYYKLRDMSDRICKEHGLSVVKNPQRHKTARSVYFAEKNGGPTRYNLMRRALDEALTMSSSWTELSAVLRKKGYVFVCDPYRRYATIRSLSAKKCMRTFRLGAEYDKEALQDRLLENQRDIRVTRRHFEFMRPYTREYARKNPLPEEYYRQRDFYLHLPRITGYLSFFRCVAIVLGVAPLYEKEYRQPLSAECREACRKLDRFTAEITLVCREHLDTPEDVQRFLARMDREMDAISAARSKIRNKQRGCADPAERVELKKSCAACTAELSRLRKQKQTAYNMIEDNPKLKAFLACELDAWVENDPYLSPREKQVLRNQRPPQEEKTIIR